MTLEKLYHARMNLVDRVIDALFPKRMSARHVDKMEQNTLLSLLSPCVVAHPDIHIVSLLPYNTPLVSSLIIEAKYHDNEQAARALGAVLAEYLDAFVMDEDAYEARPCCLVPVPLHSKRLRMRGYNQAERIAVAALAALGIPGSPSSSLLRRTRSTASQAHLPREIRLHNLEGAFEASALDPLSTYILIDDVVTTGTTFLKAAEALRASGATHVRAVALAH